MSTGQNRLLTDDKVFAIDGLVGKIEVVYREMLLDLRERWDGWYRM